MDKPGDEGGQISFRVGDEADLVVSLGPFACELARAEGSPSWRLQALRWRDAAGAWHEARCWRVVARGPAGCQLACQGSTGADAGTLEIGVEERAGAGPGAWIEWAAAGASWVGVDLAAAPDEHYLGFGERFDRLDQRGREVDLQVANGASGGLTYKPIPFFMSTAGFGLHLATDARTLVRLATPDDPGVVSIRSSAASLSLHVIPGRDLQEILSRYTASAGRPAVPPPWVLGPWKSRDWTRETRATVLEDVDEGRRQGLAGTVKLIDAAWQAYYQSLAFDPERFADAEGMIRHVKAQGYRLVLWVAPWMVWSDPPSETYRECAARGFFLRTPGGEPCVHCLGNCPTFAGSCIDFTNAGAVAWWQTQIRRLARMGVDGFKTDFGEQVPEDAVASDGRTGHELHNLYPVLYNRATYDALEQETHGILLARSAWHGSQPCQAVWAGDQSSDFGPATGLPSAIVAGQSAGLSGFPFWGSDIGGYFGTPTDEVFARWAQFGAFSPIMELHGLGCREPWHFSPETLAIYRRFAQIHMDLFPYINTFAHEAARTGLPLLRALALAYPGDAGAWGDIAEHEYLFGDRLLVAPVYFGQDRCRSLYLPPGGWRDLWTGAWHEGGRTHTVPAELDTIPVLARAGAVIPWLDPSPATCLPAEDPAIRQAGPDLRLAIYPGADSTFTLYDGTEIIWRDEEALLTVARGPMARRISASVVGGAAKLASAEVDGIPAGWELTDLNGAPADARVAVPGPGTCRLRWQPLAGLGQMV
jgi:alpha-D-xyloside xylohydrolase